MKSLEGRRFFFGTPADLTPGLRAAEQIESVEYVPSGFREDEDFSMIASLSDFPGFGYTSGRDVNTSPIWLICPRGDIPASRRVPQRNGAAKFGIDPTSHCLILRCGGLHRESGALLPGELQQPLDPSPHAMELFRVFSRELVRGFTRVRNYWVGPEALTGLRAGQRLATISIGSPRDFDLAPTIVSPISVRSAKGHP